MKIIENSLKEKYDISKWWGILIPNKTKEERYGPFGYGGNTHATKVEYEKLVSVCIPNLILFRTFFIYSMVIIHSLVFGARDFTCTLPNQLIKLDHRSHYYYYKKFDSIFQIQ